MKVSAVNSGFAGLLLAGLLVIFNSCNFAQSLEKDLITGLTTRGNGLSCEKVYLSDGEKIIERNAFIYGESIYVNFDGMEGFKRENNNAFPDMQLIVVSEQGDTALYLNDLYAEYTDGIEFSPLELYAEVTVADPMHSENNYTLYVNIKDKRGDGTFRATLDFNIVRDENIRVEGEVLTFEEIYLFSKESAHTITDGKARFNETIYILFEGLEGFIIEDGQVRLGLNMVVKDAEGNIILEEADLFGDGGQNFEDVHAQVASSLVLTGSQIANPVHYEVRIWDKQSAAWISASTEIVVE